MSIKLTLGKFIDVDSSYVCTINEYYTHVGRILCEMPSHNTSLEQRDVDEQL